MNNQNQTNQNQIRSGSKWLGLGIMMTLTIFAAARVAKRFSSKPAVRQQHLVKSNQQKNLFSIPQSIFDTCGNNFSRKNIEVDFFTQPTNELGDAWNFSVQKLDGSHTTLNTGWGKRKKKVEPIIEQNKELSAQGIMQSLPEGNLAYKTTGTHQAKQVNYPDFKNSPFSGSKGQTSQKNSNPHKTNNDSYSGGGSSESAPTTKNGLNQGSQSKNDQNTRSINSNNNSSQPIPPVQRAANNLISIIENKMLSSEKRGKNAYSTSETQQAFVALESLVRQHTTRGSQQKERLQKLQAKLAITDVINSFLTTVAHAPRTNSLTPALSRTDAQKLVSAKALQWENVLTICRNINAAPADADSVNPFVQVQEIYAKLNTLLNLCNMNPKPNPINDTFAEIRRLEQDDFADYLKNMAKNEDEWIEFLGEHIEKTFGTPWFNEMAIKGITEQAQKKIGEIFTEKKNNNATTAELEQIQQRITGTLELRLTNPLFRETLGLDLDTYRSVFANLTQSGNANKVQGLGQLLQRSGLTKTGADQLNIVTQGIMGSWIALSSALDGQLGGLFKQAIWSITNFLKTPDAQEMMATISKMAGTAVGIKAATNIFSSPISSIITLGSTMALWAKFQEINNAPDRSQKINQIGEMLANLGDTTSNIFSGLLGNFFGGGK